MWGFIQGETNMAIPYMAGSAGMKMLRTLYKGKVKLKKGTKKAADYLGKQGHAKTSSFVSGVGKKSQAGYRKAKSLAREYPKSAAALTGAIAFDMFDDD